jgi:hypothetical protein
VPLIYNGGNGGEVGVDDGGCNLACFFTLEVILYSFTDHFVSLRLRFIVLVDFPNGESMNQGGKGSAGLGTTMAAADVSGVLVEDRVEIRSVAAGFAHVRKGTVTVKQTHAPLLLLLLLLSLLL